MSDTICIDRERWERLRLFAGRMQLRHLTEPLTPLSYIGGELDALHNNDLDPISEPDENPALPRPERGTIHYNNDYILSVDRNPSLPKGKQFDWELMDTNYEDVAKGTAPGIWGAMIGAQAAMIHATAGEPKNE